MWPVLALAGTVAAAPGRAEPPLLAASLARVAAEKGAAGLVGDAGLGAYVARAMGGNPGLAAARRAWQASAEEAQAATALPDPLVSYTYFAREVETRVGPQRHKVGVSQALPWPGVRGLRGAAAQARAAAAAHRLAQARLDLYRTVVEAYAEYYYLGRAAAVARQHVELMTHLEEVARTRYGTGAAPHSAAIRAQVELARLGDRVGSLEDRRPAAAARLAAALGVGAAAPRPWPQTLAVRADTVDAAAARAWLASSPALRALEEQERAATAAADLAAKRSRPEVALGIEYVETGKPLAPDVAEAGKDPIMAMITATVPVWRGAYRAAARAASLERAAVQARRRDLAVRLEAGLAQALYMARDGRRRMALYRDVLVPLAEQSLEVARQGFEVSDGSFAALTEAQRQLLELELGYERALADRAVGLARASALVNRDLVGAAVPAPVEADGKE